MVDWATQNRLFPTGYQSIDVRCQNASIDLSLPYSVALNKRHNCSSQEKQSKVFEGMLIFTEHLHHGLNPASYFDNERRKSKLIATYTTNIDWPRSICCLSETDGSLIICEQERCRLLLFTSRLVLRSICGGKRGNGPYEFDSPWSVATLFDSLSSSILVADTNNRRIQFFTIDYNGNFVYKYNIMTKEKPYFVGTSKRHFAVSCEKSFIVTYSANERIELSNINLKKITIIKTNINSAEIAFCLCLDPETSYLFVNNPVVPQNLVHQLTITGEYLRLIKLDKNPFLHISSLTFDTRNRQLVMIDSLNSVIYSVEYDFGEDNVEILLKRSDNVNYPQTLCISNEGHMVVVECSVLTQHALKLFQYHSRLPTFSLKTSESASVRSIGYQY